MPIFKTVKKILVDPMKEQFVENMQRFGEADTKYQGPERVVAKANAAIGGLTSPMAPIMQPLQKGVEKGMEVLDKAGKNIANKIGDMLTDEQKATLKAKIAPRFQGEGADKVSGVLQKIMESPYTEAGITAVTAILGGKAAKGIKPKNYVAIYNPEGKIMNPRVVTPSKIFKAKQPIINNKKIPDLVDTEGNNRGQPDRYVKKEMAKRNEVKSKQARDNYYNK